MRKTAGISGLLLVLSVTVTFATENPLLGTWKLKAFVREVLATGERYNQRGSYSADGRMYAIIVSDDRINPHNVAPTGEQRAELHESMIAYAGAYTLDGEKVIHHVDISWNEAWTGTDQVRFYKLDGNILNIIAAPGRSPVDGREGRAILVFERVKSPDP